MALSLSNFLYPCCAFLLFCLAQAATVVHDFNITWVYTNPDGLYPKSTIAINNQWPTPTLNITKGDRLIVNVNNQLGNESVSLHWHGIYLANQTHMDGVVGGTQCGIPPGSSGTYNFTVDQPGTYWYHSHVRGQYPDGLRAPLIVQDPESPFAGQYDEEVVLSVSDWYHEHMPVLIKSFINVDNPTGAEPIPDSALMNDSQNVTFAIEAGKTYFFRIVNIGAFAGQYLWFEGHNMTIIEVDGIYTEPTEASMIYLAVAQRYGVLITARNDTSSNFAVVGSMDKVYFDVVPDSLNTNVTGWLVYDAANELPTPTLLDDFAPFDDFTLVPYDQEKIYDNVSQTLVLNMVMGNLGDGANYAFINDATYVGPKVPTLYSVLTTGANATDASIYGVNTNPFVLKYNEVIEIVLNNLDTGKHPWHLHGHDFQVVARSEKNAGIYANNVTLVETPMRRDTLLVQGGGHFVIRFRSDNPGVWLFHCHIEWHVDSGLIATMVEAPLEMQKFITIPEDQYELCRAQGVPIAGNAAGNTKDYLDISGANVSPAPLPAGFTARGIVALVFSCISAVLGIAAITWYGMAPMGNAEFLSAKKMILEAGIEPPK